MRAQEARAGRESKLERVRKEARRQEEYLATHARASALVALRKAQEKALHLKLSSWVQIEESGRLFTVTVLPEALAEASKLDGCYVLKTDLVAAQCPMHVIHDRYKDLAKVEWAFRTSKTAQLEMRPLYLRLAERTSAHALVVMLAYRITKELSDRWSSLNLTVEEGLRDLDTLRVMEVSIQGQPRFNQIPKPLPLLQQLLNLAKVQLPEALPCNGVKVATRKKLQKKRQNV